MNQNILVPMFLELLGLGREIYLKMTVYEKELSHDNVHQGD